jgi:dCMP deaminase
MRQSRPSWDDYFMEIARLVATRSTCLRRQVGAVVVREKRILATGYNGAPKGLSHCLDIGCLREQMQIPHGERHELCRGIHAEQNAIIQAATSGANIDGAVIYSTHFPCSLCMKMIINSGIKKIFYVEGYPDDLSKSLCKEANLKLVRLKLDENQK